MFQVTITSGAGVPFGVKSGGHAINQKHSSTEGVLISMTQFRGKVYDAEAQTAYIGTGQVWEDVVTYLEPYNVSVVGMRVIGTGIGGFTLGGGKHSRLALSNSPADSASIQVTPTRHPSAVSALIPCLASRWCCPAAKLSTSLRRSTLTCSGLPRAARTTS